MKEQLKNHRHRINRVRIFNRALIYLQIFTLQMEMYSADVVWSPKRYYQFRHNFYFCGYFIPYFNIFCQKSLSMRLSQNNQLDNLISCMCAMNDEALCSEYDFISKWAQQTNSVGHSILNGKLCVSSKCLVDLPI